jgi:hypothetical protein
VVAVVVVLVTAAAAAAVDERATPLLHQHQLSNHAHARHALSPHAGRGAAERNAPAHGQGLST